MVGDAWDESGDRNGWMPEGWYERLFSWLLEGDPTQHRFRLTCTGVLTDLRDVHP
jgi:hypothetical protein